MFDRQLVVLALSFAFASAGSNIAARMAIIAITTSSSIRVKAPLEEGLLCLTVVIGNWFPGLVAESPVLQPSTLLIVTMQAELRMIYSQIHDRWSYKLATL